MVKKLKPPQKYLDSLLRPNSRQMIAKSCSLSQYAINFLIYGSITVMKFLLEKLEKYLPMVLQVEYQILFYFLWATGNYSFAKILKF